MRDFAYLKEVIDHEGRAVLHDGPRLLRIIESSQEKHPLFSTGAFRTLCRLNLTSSFDAPDLESTDLSGEALIEKLAHEYSVDEGEAGEAVAASS